MIYGGNAKKHTLFDAGYQHVYGQYGFFTMLYIDWHTFLHNSLFLFT